VVSAIEVLPGTRGQSASADHARDVPYYLMTAAGSADAY
jgi:hypothetical protein